MCRGIVVSYETVRRYCQKFGQSFADRLCRRPRPGKTWYMDEVFIRIEGVQHYQDGMTTFILRRHRRAASVYRTARTEAGIDWQRRGRQARSQCSPCPIRTSRSVSMVVAPAPRRNRTGDGYVHT